uniref:Uncharacterized protein n=1 Tax=Agrobacterium tumefaciens TaxID=358 RepID=A0A2Z2PX49_AGRTU|nr:hypothetical protein [Agrobacterium tumefaciens]ASK47198.1 hypothetical protein [Agrobacterium radiobacter]
MQYIEYKLIFILENCVIRGGYIVSLKFIIEVQLALPYPKRQLVFQQSVGHGCLLESNLSLTKAHLSQIKLNKLAMQRNIIMPLYDVFPRFTCTIQF